MLTARKRQRLRDGIVIPAHALALHADGSFDEGRQRGLTDYYLGHAGAGGVAVGVHTTQFEIRDPDVGLYEPVLRMAAEQARAHDDAVLVAGVLGPTDRAVREAQLAASVGYDVALVAMAGWKDAPEGEILAGVAAVAEVMPVFGFYMQSTLTGRRFGYDFWRRYAEIPGVVGIKIAPFDRYDTIDVVRAVVDAGRSTPQGREDDIALYTGNDDNIVFDLLTPFRFGDTAVHIVGGLLGQWAVWTPAAVELHRRIRSLVTSGADVPLDLLRLGADLTAANAAVFDPGNAFAGSIAGVNEALARSGLLAGNRCLSDAERLSPGQADEVTRVMELYPDICRTW
ncbi:MAG: dihydrodipicolinate synthase family protein [Microbacterium sp.]|nr:dihydrodipicolinate synthase family protein [Microbacterium sp.]